MRRHRPSAALATAALSVIGLTGIGLTATALPAAAEAPASDAQTARFEQDFLEDMIGHHMMAVMMAEMCVEKAVHPELISTCESIVASQSAQVEQMTTWLEDWYGVTYEPTMTGMGSMHRLMDLDGAEFEVAFMRTMIRHHWTAIREAETCLREAEHAELRGLCEEIYTAQLSEIEQMQTWLAQWYGMTGGRPVKTA